MVTDASPNPESQSQIYRYYNYNYHCRLQIACPGNPRSQSEMRARQMRRRGYERDCMHLPKASKVLNCQKLIMIKEWDNRTMKVRMIERWHDGASRRQWLDSWLPYCWSWSMAGWRAGHGRCGVRGIFIWFLALLAVLLFCCMLKPSSCCISLRASKPQHLRCLNKTKQEFNFSFLYLRALLLLAFTFTFTTYSYRFQF